VDYEFLTQFHPRIINVFDKNVDYWKHTSYHLVIERSSPNVNTLGYVYKGKAFFEINHHSFSAQPGTIFRITPASRLNIKTSEEDCLQCYSIHYYYSLIQWEGAVSQAVPGEQGLPFPPYVHTTDPELYDLFRQTYASWQAKKIDYEWQTKLLLLSIVNKVQMVSQANKEQIQSQSDLIHRAIEYIQNHYTEPINRDTLAAYVSLSPSYFSTLFKARTGLTPMEYITKLRLDKAKQLLLSTRLPITQIAMGVGFANSFYFTRVFKKHTGLSPREFRKN